MEERTTPRRWGAALLTGTLVVATACSSDVIDQAAESGDEVSEQVDESADDLDDAGGDLAAVLDELGLDSLASAAEEIDISEVAGTDEFTFFAPDDEAFQSLEADDIAQVLADPLQLEEVLRRHIVADTVDADALVEMDSIETTGGSSLDIVVDGDMVTVGDATVVRADVEFDNGVVHVVDRIFVDG